MRRFLDFCVQYLRDRVHKRRCKRAIRLARRNYLRHVTIDGKMPSGYEGVCWYLEYALRYEFDEYTRVEYDSVAYIQRHLPNYTYENAQRLFGATGVDTGYWWKAGDWQSRVRFLNWLEESL